MQVSDSTELSASVTPIPDAPRSHRKPGTIPVTVRLDPFRYDRLKRLVRRFSTTGQNIIQTALDRSMVSLERERERASQAEIAGQSLLFAPAIDIEASIARKPKQDSFAFVRPEPTVALTYRATVPTHRWLHRRSAETGMTTQEIITDALKMPKVLISYTASRSNPHRSRPPTRIALAARRAVSQFTGSFQGTNRSSIIAWARADA